MASESDSSLQESSESDSSPPSPMSASSGVDSNDSSVRSTRPTKKRRRTTADSTADPKKRGRPRAKKSTTPTKRARRAPTDDEDEEDEEESDEEEAAAAASSVDEPDSEDEPMESTTKAKSRKRSRSRGGAPTTKGAGASKKKKGGGGKKNPGPIIVNGVPQWTVSRIMAEDADETGTTVYLVKWEGFVGADTWEPIESLAGCAEVLEDWRKEKAAIAAAGGNATRYPIHHRGEKKVKLQKRSYASDQAWLERQIAKDKRAKQKAAKTARKAETAAKRKARAERAAHMRKQLDATSSGARKSTVPERETPAERKARLAAERAEEQRRAEERKAAFEAQLACSEPFYYVTADDSLLMVCMDSGEEEEWGVGATKKCLLTRDEIEGLKRKNAPGTGARKVKSRDAARPIPPLHRNNNSASATPSPNDPNSSGDESEHEVRSHSAARSSKRSTSNDTAALNVSNPLNAQNTMAIHPEEWSDEDLERVGDGRGADRKLKLFAARDHVEEVQEILQIRLHQPPPTFATAALSASSTDVAAGVVAEAASAANGDSGLATAASSDEFEYLVRWKAATRKPLSWEPESNLKGAQCKIITFLEKKRRTGWRLEHLKLATNAHASSAAAAATPNKVD